MLDYIKQRIAIWKWKRSSLGAALHLHTQKYFFEQTALTDFKQESKERLIMEFYRRIAEITSGSNPVMACRVALAEYVLMFARLQVLCLRESEKESHFFRDNPYISGQLWRHIREASAHSEELARFIWETPDLSDDELVGGANVRCALFLYYANGLNIVRMDMGDSSEQKDWFRPFVEACLVNEEHLMREKLSLPPLIPGFLGSLQYAVFLDIIISGEPQPFFAWTRDFPEAYLAGEGPAPKLALAE